MWFIWKILTIAWWYVAGTMIASSLDPKKKKKIKKIKEDWWDVMQFLLNDFVETHKKLFESAKEEVLTPENKKKFESKKKQLMKLADSYKKQAEKTLIDLKENGVEAARNWIIRMEEIYEEQKLKVDELIIIAPGKASDFKDTFLDSASNLKNEIIKKMK